MGPGAKSSFIFKKIFILGQKILFFLAFDGNLISAHPELVPP
jgi:hypothetical protein